MKDVNIFLLGKKGLDSIMNLDTKFLEHINHLIIGTDKNIVNDYSKDIEDFAIKNSVNFVYRSKFQENILFNSNLNIAIGWRWIIKSDVNLIVFHDSLLPKYRGFNPLVSALINGDNIIGVTAIKGVEEFDRGDIIGQRSLRVEYPIKIAEAIDKLSLEYAKLLNSIIKSHNEGQISFAPQDESMASYSLWRDEEDYNIDWKESSANINRLINSVGFPYKGASCKVEDKVYRILNAEIGPDVTIINRVPGKVLFKNGDIFSIVCGKGILAVSKFYDENGGVVDFKNKFRLRFK